jgi:hypothetical protein
MDCGRIREHDLIEFAEQEETERPSKSITISPVSRLMASTKPTSPL